MLISLLPDEIMALTIYGEARGESIDGQVAVGNVIFNRFKNNINKYKSVKDVCLESYQFSCWNENDPNRELLIKLSNQLENNTLNNGILKQCLYISRGILRNELIDNVKGNVNYMVSDLYNSEKKPKWANNPKSKPIIIGSHIFFSV